MSQSIFSITKFLLVFIGLWTLFFQKNTIWSKIYKLYSIFIQVSYILFAISCFIQFGILLGKKDSTERVFSCVSLAIIILENSVKSLVYIKNRIPDLFHDILEAEKRIQTETPLVVETYTKTVLLAKIVNCLQCLAVLLTANMLIINSTLELKSMGRDLFKTKPFMHDSWYLLEPQNHLVYVCLYQAYFTITGFFLNTATLTCLAVLIIFTSSQLKILGVRLRNVGNDVAEVKELIRQHQHIIHFVTTLNGKTKYVMLIDFVLNSVNLATCMMQIIIAGSSKDLLYTAGLSMIVFLQIFVFAWFSNEVKYESLRIADAIYESKWYIQSRKIKRLLHIMMMRSKKPLLLTIGPFSPMTNDTALSMVKAAYTYLSIMRTTANK